MFKKIVSGSLFGGGCVILGHFYYYKNKNKNYNDCIIINKENIEKSNLLTENMKINLIEILYKK